MKESDLSRIEAADRQLLAVAKGIKILSRLAWPPQMRDTFLEGWRRGEPRIPEIPRVPSGFDEEIPILERLAVPMGDHPMARFLAETAGSYLDAAHLLNNVGTPAFTEISCRLYGEPRTLIGPGSATNLEAAERLLESIEQLSKSSGRSRDPRVSSEVVRRRMANEIDTFFVEDPVRVVIDESLASKAAAGAEAVRLRKGADFSENDVLQLIHHEAFVHSATGLNGRRQPRLTCLSLSAPRTTATQEGLATFAEFISTAIDLNRLRRLALRVKGTQVAMEGGDFVDVFECFLEGGQEETESFHSAMRCFRGGDPRGRIAFTKDVVYLGGLLETHGFFLSALQERRVDMVDSLFAGRMTWTDAVDLAPFFGPGMLQAPRYVPPWASNDRLAAYLAFSNLADRLFDGAVDIGNPDQAGA